MKAALYWLVAGLVLAVVSIVISTYATGQRLEGLAIAGLALFFVSIGCCLVGALVVARAGIAARRRAGRGGPAA